jgi:hypothetical protein
MGIADCSDDGTYVRDWHIPDRAFKSEKHEIWKLDFCGEIIDFEEHQFVVQLEKIEVPYPSHPFDYSWHTWLYVMGSEDVADKYQVPCL